MSTILRAFSRRSLSWRFAREFEEWKNNKPPVGSSRLIPIEDIMDAVGLGEHKNEILDELRMSNAVASFFEQEAAK